MKTAGALILGILLGASGKFIHVAQAEKPKVEEQSAAEQMCYVLVKNEVLRKCYWTP